MGVALEAGKEGSGIGISQGSWWARPKRKFLNCILFGIIFLSFLWPQRGELWAQSAQKEQAAIYTQGQRGKDSQNKRKTTTRTTRTSQTNVTKAGFSSASPTKSQEKPLSSKTGTPIKQSTSSVRSAQRVRGNGSANLEPYKAAVVMDATTGEILTSHDPHRRLIPASLTKMMLVLIVMEKLRAGRLKLSEPVVATEWTTGVGGTQVDLKPGEVLPLEELLQAIMIRSANDAAATVAEHVAGSQARFVDMMNLKAKAMGMKDTFFVNVHGLPGPNGLDNISTAYDMAILARALLRYPEVLRWSSQEVGYIRGGRYPIHNTNKLLGQCEGVDGLKTGFVRKAGFNIVATGSKDGKRVIAVVMGSPSSDVRNRVTADLLSWALGTPNGQKKTLGAFQPRGASSPKSASRRTRSSAARGGS